MELVEIANHFGTDKGNQIGHAHNYAAFYSFLFESIRSEYFSMLEIGLQRGGVEAGSGLDRVGSDVPSVRTWLEYFPNVEIYGFDLSDFSHINLPRFHFYRGDLGNLDDMDKLSSILPKLRVLVDDGSHASFHQQLAFVKLFPKVEPGGFYIIEDFHWQPPFEKSLTPCLRSSELFERFSRTGQLEIAFAHPDYLVDLASDIQHVYIHRNNCGGVNGWQLKMVAIQKKLNT
jgi:hypothetical protein